MAVDRTSQTVLSPECQVISDRDAQSMNIAAGIAIGEVVRTTLGPRGMDKLLVDSAGMGIVTNDGASIIRDLNIDHPAANLVTNVAKKQEEAVGDGTTTALAITSALLGKAEKLLEQGLHPTLIAEGYALAHSAATEELREAALHVEEDDVELESIVRTALSGKSPGLDQDELVDVTARAARAAWANDTAPDAFTEVAKDVGGDVSETWLMEGVVLENDCAHAEMPALVEEPTIAVIDGPVDVETDEMEASVRIDDSERISLPNERERQERESLCTAILDLGVDVVVSAGDIAPLIQQRLANAGVYATRRQSPEDLDATARATGATARHSIGAISTADLGTCESVAERIVGGDSHTSIEGAPRENAATIIIRGGTRNVVDEVNRAVDDALSTAGIALENGDVVPGGGGAEAFAAQRIRDRATSVDDRIQLAVRAFADALETVPRTLAENSGQNPLDVLAGLRRACEIDDEPMAIDAMTGDIVSASEEGILDPLKVKVRALSCAAQVATMLLRIDDVVAADELVGGDVTTSTETETDD